ncbi:hypothetical protein [Chloroflexus sp.]|uniref:hypothetical protein n=1 Tax=Chloroflexus sp. TaxID=1904827 RepID=UPI002ACE602D|nr:hypothetical protein [Chloroflexus sp.]
MASRRRPGAPADFEEIRPNLFLIHNPALGPVLRGEGEREGFHFHLTSWRRAGLLGRLASRGFVTLTIPDRIAALPAPPSAPLGPLRHLTISAKQQLSVLDLNAPNGWRSLLVSPNGALELPEGQIVRRRHGRGPADYLRITATGWQALPVDEAILAAYGQLPDPPILRLAPTAEGWMMPEIPLPEAYRNVLGIIAQPHPAGWLLAGDLEREWGEMIVAKLGVKVGAVL